MFQEVKSIGDYAEIVNLLEDIFINRNNMHVSDMGNHRVCQMNEQEFVLLNSGLYRL